MRTKKELNSKEFRDDLMPLYHLLVSRKIPCSMQLHKGWSEEIEKLLGYSPVGKYQIIIDDKYSVIRGMASWGLYEIMNIKNGKKFEEPERFETPEELLKVLESYFFLTTNRHI